MDRESDERGAARRVPRRRLGAPRLALHCLIALASGAAGADWSGGVEGGTVVRDGGSATRLSVSLVEDGRPLTHALRADWLRYDEGSGYRAAYVPRYWLSEALYLFGDLEARRDRPFGIEAGYRGIVGGGYRVLDTATQGLGVELGLGGRHTEFELGGEESEGLALARAAYRLTLVDDLRFGLDAEILQGETLGEVHAEASLAYRVPGGGAIRLGYRVRRLSRDGAPTIEDDAPSLSLTYGF